MKKYRVSYETRERKTVIEGVYAEAGAAFRAAVNRQAGYWVDVDAGSWGRARTLLPPRSVTVADVEVEVPEQKTPQDWLREFYPVPADSPEARAAPAQHSLRKWRGVRPATLRQYGVAVVHDVMLTNTGLVLNAQSCALCVVYRKDGGCSECPLRRFGSGDDPDFGCDDGSPYNHFHKTGDPERLIAALEQIVAEEEAAKTGVPASWEAL